METSALFDEYKNTVFYDQVDYSDDPYEDIESTLRKLLGNVGDMETFFRSVGSVFIKPNRVDYYLDNAEVTDIKLVEAVIKYIRSINPSIRILMGERPMASRDDEDALIILNPLIRLSERLGVDFINPDQAERISFPCGKVPLSFPREFIESDLIINLPKLKTHHQADWSGAMKNFIGLLTPEEMGTIHDKMDIANGIVLINEILEEKRIVTIMDMVEVQEEWGPHCGKKRFLGLLLLGFDNFSIDTAAVGLAGHDPQQFRVFKESERILKRQTAQVRCHGPKFKIDNSLVLSPPWLFDTNKEYSFAGDVNRYDESRLLVELRVYNIDRKKIEMGGEKRFFRHFFVLLPLYDQEYDDELKQAAFVHASSIAGYYVSKQTCTVCKKSLNIKFVIIEEEERKCTTICCDCFNKREGK